MYIYTAEKLTHLLLVALILIAYLKNKKHNNIDNFVEFPHNNEDTK